MVTAQSHQRHPLCRFAARNRGMIATGNHYYLDSLRGAPPPKGAARKAPLKGELPPQRLRGAVGTCGFMKPRANTHNPTWLPDGGAVEQSETERGSRQLWFLEGSGEFVPAIFCCHSTHPSKRSRCGGPLSQPLRAASSPNGGAKEASANSPWCIPMGILRTAGNPSGAVRRLPFQGRLDHPKLTRWPCSTRRQSLA